MSEKLKSPIVWAGILAQLILLATLVSPDLANYVKIIGGSLLEIATIIGFLNNPNNRKGF